MRIPNLDLYEQQVFHDLVRKNVEPEQALKVLINSVEGDYSQLSEGLLAYGKERGIIC